MLIAFVYFLAATKQLLRTLLSVICLSARKQRFSLQLMTSCCMNFAIIIQWIYFTIWEKIKKNRHHYNTILSFYNIKTLQEEFAKKSNIPWIWRIIYGHKLPYMKKTRKQKQVCGAACFMAAEIKFSKDVRKLHFVRTITRHRFELKSPNLHQTCILGYSWLVLKKEVIDLDLQGHFGHFVSVVLSVYWNNKHTLTKRTKHSARIRRSCVAAFGGHGAGQHCHQRRSQWLRHGRNRPYFKSTYSKWHTLL